MCDTAIRWHNDTFVVRKPVRQATVKYYVEDKFTRETQVVNVICKSKQEAEKFSQHLLLTYNIKSAIVGG